MLHRRADPHGHPGETAQHALPPIAEGDLNAAGNLVVPPFVEPHIHLDATLTAGEPAWTVIRLPWLLLDRLVLRPIGDADTFTAGLLAELRDPARGPG